MRNKGTEHNLEEISSHLNQSLEVIKHRKNHDAEKVFAELLGELESYNPNFTDSTGKSNIETLLKT